MDRVFILLMTVFLLTACNNDDEGGDVILPTAQLDIKFEQVFDGGSISGNDFGITVFTNELGQEMFFTRIRYLISRIALTDVNTNEIYEVEGYRLVDMADPGTYDIDANLILPQGSYRVSFIYGFNEADNQDGAYGDLNQASWNWPMILGGGYNFLQMDGNFKDSSGNTQAFNYHNGTARVSDGVFEQNFLAVDFPEVLEVTENDDTVSIIMDVAEWFRNPYTWDLEVYNTPLMPNYEAQKLMNDNAASVFSVEIN